jgi:hypothetical protein
MEVVTTKERIEGYQCPRKLAIFSIVVLVLHYEGTYEAAKERKPASAGVFYYSSLI